MGRWSWVRITQRTGRSVLGLLVPKAGLCVTCSCNWSTYEYCGGAVFPEEKHGESGRSPYELPDCLVRERQTGIPPRPLRVSTTIAFIGSAYLRIAPWLYQGPTSVPTNPNPVHKSCQRKKSPRVWYWFNARTTKRACLWCVYQVCCMRMYTCVRV